MNSRPKWTEARNMNTIVRPEIQFDWKWPMERLCVEKPPVAQTLKAWQMASNGPIPASR